jgi:hypothetical protein
MFKHLSVSKRFLSCLVVSAVLLADISLVSASELIERSIAITAGSHNLSVKSQQYVDVLSDETKAMVDTILQNDRQSNIAEAYNSQLSILIRSQISETKNLKAQIDSIEETEQAMLPLLNIMVGQLNDFVSSDLPFLSDERQKRLAKLNSLLDRADVSVAEKYRQILEAYLIEVGYGRTIEAYSGTLIGSDQGDLSTYVNYLRVGRVALYYQNLHGQGGGVWLPAKDQWQVLDSEENLVVMKAIQIAQQQRAPELLPLPIPTSKIY